MGRALLLSFSTWSLLWGIFPAVAQEGSLYRQAAGDIISDHDSFYSSNSLRHLSVVLVGAWVLANTAADEEIQDWYREEIRSRETDDVSRLVKPMGNGRAVVPACVVTLILGHLAGDAPSGSLLRQWSGRSLRAMLLGAPPVLFLQVATGASRPSEGDSRWHPFEDDNGVSGHSFVGAVPFLSAARMTQDRLPKSLFYVGSMLCGLSRVNDDAHYLSQSALGWWVAYLATGSVEETESRRPSVHLLPAAPFVKGKAAVTLIITF
jgi:hypothetical protein